MNKQYANFNNLETYWWLGDTSAFRKDIFKNDGRAYVRLMHNDTDTYLTAGSPNMETVDTSKNLPMLLVREYIKEIDSFTVRLLNEIKGELWDSPLEAISAMNGGKVENGVAVIPFSFGDIKVAKVERLMVLGDKGEYDVPSSFQVLDEDIRVIFDDWLNVTPTAIERANNRIELIKQSAWNIVEI